MIPPDLALIAWIPAVFMAFLIFSNRTAILLTVILGWMFLPAWGFPISGFIDYTKTTAIAMAGIIGVLVFDGDRLFRLVPQFWDIPIILFCVLPGMTMIYLGYSPYAAISSVIYGLLGYAVPYFLGRLYFSDSAGLRDLAIGILLGVLLYVPFCMYEIRMSPQLNNIVYGFSQHSFLQSIRYGGYRPLVFMDHGLMVGLWMSAGSLIALHMWQSGTVRRIMGIPIAPIVAILFLTTVLVKSTGALVLLFIALGAYLTFRVQGRRWIYALIICIPILYVSVRVTGTWSGQGLLESLMAHSPERAQSLAFRMGMEDTIIRETAPYFLTGRGPWAFASATDASGEEIKIVLDSLWILVFASSGLLTLVSMLVAFLRPLAVMWKVLAQVTYRDQNVTCAFSLALVLGMFFLDSMFNAMVNPVYLLIMGGLTGFGMRRC